MPIAIVTGSGGLIGSESVRHSSSGLRRDRARERHARAASSAPRRRPPHVTERARRRARRASARSTLDIRDADGVERRVRRARARASSWSSTPPRSRRTTGRRPIRRPTSRSTPTARSTCCRRRASTRPTRRSSSARRTRSTATGRTSCRSRSARRGSSCPRTTAGTAASTRRCRSTATTHSLFGVSKAAADLLVQEYGRYFDMPTVCFRGGCLTGPAARRRAAARLPRLPHALHGHRRAVHDLRLRRQAGARQHPRARRGRAPSTPSTRLRARPRSTTSAAGATATCSMLEAIALCEQIAGPRSSTTRCSTRRAIGDHRWWISDLDAFKRDYPRVGADVRDRGRAAGDPRPQRRALAGRGGAHVVG